MILTDKTLSISYSKEVEVIKTLNVVEIDWNLNNTTTASSKEVNVYELSRATKFLTRRVRLNNAFNNLHSFI